MSKSSVNQYGSSVLKGIAILAVITIHTLSSLDNAYALTNPFGYASVSLDQLTRFSVPLFVALSGYGFWQKYQGYGLSFWSFISRQAIKLLPLYFLACLVSYLVFYFVPEWRDPIVTESFITQFITGRADYQLYFVPMIFQLYLLFPLLRTLVIKLRWRSLLVAGLFQFWFYSSLSTDTIWAPLAPYLASDQQIYFWFFTWIFYFILGMHMGDIVVWLTAKSYRLIAVTVATILSWVGVSYSAITQIQLGIDPLVATSFTRIEMLLYATCAVVTLFAVISLRTLHSQRKSVLSKVGDISYPLYLFHTLALRLLLA